MPESLFAKSKNNHPLLQHSWACFYRSGCPTVKKLRSEHWTLPKFKIFIRNPQLSTPLPPMAHHGPSPAEQPMQTRSFGSLTQCGFIWPYPGISAEHGVTVVNKSHAVAVLCCGFPVRDHLNFLLCHRHWQQRQMGDGLLSCHDVKSKLVQNSPMHAD